MLNNVKSKRRNFNGRRVLWGLKYYYLLDLCRMLGREKDYKAIETRIHTLKWTVQDAFEKPIRKRQSCADKKIGVPDISTSEINFFKATPPKPILKLEKTINLNPVVENLLYISDVAKILNVDESTIRRCEKKHGFKIKRNEVGYRIFTKNDINLISERLNKVKKEKKRPEILLKPNKITSEITSIKPNKFTLFSIITLFSLILYKLIKGVSK